MSGRKLNYADEAAAIADIEHLRKSYAAEGDWTLAQAAFHCGWPLSQPKVPATTDTLTDRQKPMRAFIDNVNANGWPDKTLPARPEMVPPADVADSAIDDCIAGLRSLAACKIAVLENPVFGPLPIDVYRKFTLIHAAHHFSFFHPTA
ncbi:MAG: hypothetical protein JWM57_62 [Phycisphaerales bacterium]|nr:hypothetical protein [Phycisphaerales bacterium]